MKQWVGSMSLQAKLLPEMLAAHRGIGAFLVQLLIDVSEKIVGVGPGAWDPHGRSEKKSDGFLVSARCIRAHCSCNYSAFFIV